MEENIHRSFSENKERDAHERSTPDKMRKANEIGKGDQLQPATLGDWNKIRHNENNGS